MHCAKRGLAAAGLAAAIGIVGAFSGSIRPAMAEGLSSLTVGGGMAVKPKYEGSDDYEVVGLPLIIPKFSKDDEREDTRFRRFRERVKFEGLDDIRFRVLEHNGFEIGPVAGYRSGRDQDDARRLNGLGDIDGGLVLGGYAGYHIGALLFDVSAATQVSGDDSGLQIRLGAETEQQVSAATKLSARIGTTIASDDYMDTYFGITSVQSATSGAGLPVFDADGGIKDVHFELGSQTDLNDRWVIRLKGRYARLLGDAADSPVIETEDQFSGLLGLGYKFHFNR